MFVLEFAFTDDPRRLAARPAHRERLARLHAEGVAVMAGPFADGSGSMVIFDVPDAATLDRILADDPYYTTPGVAVVRRAEWSPFIRWEPTLDPELARCRGGEAARWRGGAAAEQPTPSACGP